MGEKGGFTSKKGSKNFLEKKSGVFLGLKIISPSKMLQNSEKIFCNEGRNPLGFHQQSGSNFLGGLTFTLIGVVTTEVSLEGDTGELLNCHMVGGLKGVD